MKVKGILSFQPLEQIKDIDKLDLSNKILDKVDWDNIDSIYVYGSYVDRKYKVIPAKSYFWGLFKVDSYKEEIKPNDLDILILTKENYQIPTESKSNIRGKSLVHGAYESWWVDTDYKNYLHLLVANKNDWKKALEEKDEMALRINKQIQRIF